MARTVSILMLGLAIGVAGSVCMIVPHLWAIVKRFNRLGGCSYYHYCCDVDY